MTITVWIDKSIQFTNSNGIKKLYCHSLTIFMGYIWDTFIDKKHLLFYPIYVIQPPRYWYVLSTDLWVMDLQPPTASGGGSGRSLTWGRSTRIGNHGTIQDFGDLVGGWPTPPKNMSQLGSVFPIYGKIKHVPNISKPPTSPFFADGLNSHWTHMGVS